MIPNFRLRSGAARLLAPASLALLGLPLGAGVVVLHQSAETLAPGRAYTVAAVTQDPGSWSGRTVAIRARVQPCPWWGRIERAQRCAGLQLVLIDASSAAPGATLPLEQPSPNPLVTTLRRLPLLGAVLRRPDAIPLFATARFRVQVQALPAASGLAPRYEARLFGFEREST